MFGWLKRKLRGLGETKYPMPWTPMTPPTPWAKAASKAAPKAATKTAHKGAHKAARKRDEIRTTPKTATIGKRAKGHRRFCGCMIGTATRKGNLGYSVLEPVVRCRGAMKKSGAWVTRPVSPAVAEIARGKAKVCAYLKAPKKAAKRSAHKKGKR